MAYELKNRVRGTTTTTGTGTYTIGAAPTGFQGFDQITSGRQVYYCAVLNGDWEVGIGTVTVGGSTTLSRDTILESSDSGSAVNWGVGSKEIFIVDPAQILEALSYDGTLRHGDFSGTIKVAGKSTLQGGVNVAGSVGGTANAITATLTPTISAYGDNMVVVLTPASTNTAAATLALNGLTARSIVSQVFSGNPSAMALVAGDLVAGVPAVLYYDLANTRWVLLNPAGLFRRASPTKLLTSANSPYTAVAGDNLAIDKSSGSVTVTLPASPAITDAPIRITHVAGASNTLTVARNGKVIQGTDEDMTIDDFSSVQLGFVNDTVGWRILNAALGV